MSALQNRNHDPYPYFWWKWSAKTFPVQTNQLKSTFFFRVQHANRNTHAALEEIQTIKLIKERKYNQIKQKKEQNMLPWKNSTADSPNPERQLFQLKTHNINRSYVQHRLKSKSRSSTSFKPYMLAAGVLSSVLVNHCQRYVLLSLLGWFACRVF